MMKEEFERIAGYEVSESDYYNIIEKMYMSCDLNKEDFVKTINKKRFALETRNHMKSTIKGYAKSLTETFLHYTDYATKEAMYSKLEEYTSRFYGGNYSFYISEEMKFSCFYPVKVEIFHKETGRTIETMVFRRCKI